MTRPRPRYEIVRVFADDAPRQTAWAILEDGEAVDYRSTKAEAQAVVTAIRAALKAWENAR